MSAHNTDLKNHLESLYCTRNTLLDYKQLSEIDWESIRDYKPFEYAIEEEYSSHAMSPLKCLENLEAASYYSLSLTLMFGINIALFLEPIAKYGSNSLKSKVLTDFIKHKKTGGLMITEPSFGTDALNMETTFEIKGDRIQVKGTKHWQGLTGQADYWLVAGRVLEDGTLSKQVSFCLIPQEQIRYELYDTHGLKPIQYGINHIDTEIPLENMLIHKKGDNSMILDLLNRSRMQFVGMGSGFVKRSLDTAVEATSNRIIRGKKLIALPEVKYNIIKLQNFYTLSKACFLYSSKYSGIEYDLQDDTIVANTIKVTITEMMQKSTDLNLQLGGGNSFKESSFGFHGLRDSRPFLIFEGPNEMLSNQIARLTLLGMKKAKIDSVIDYLHSEIKGVSKLPAEIYDQFDYAMNDLLLRDGAKKVAMSQSLIALVNIHFIESLRKTGFSSYMIDNTLVYLKNQLRANRAIIESEDSCLPLELV